MKKDYYTVFRKASILTETKAYFAANARKRIYKLFIDKIKPLKTDKIIDVGVSPIISLVNAKRITNNFFEELYPYKNCITATSIEDASFLEKAYPGLRFRQTKPYKTPFEDREFDALFCNAVIEHTGDRSQQKKFIYEYVRVAKRFLFTTPNRWFPIEMHSMIPVLHWFPAKVFRKILKILKIEYLAQEKYLNLLSTKEFVSLFPKEVEIHMVKIRTLGWTSNIVIYGEWKVVNNNK